MHIFIISMFILITRKLIAEATISENTVVGFKRLGNYCITLNLKKVKSLLTFFNFQISVMKMKKLI